MKVVFLLLKDWKRTSHWKNWGPDVFHKKPNFSVWLSPACGITVEGMKTISSFLSHDGIVLEELDLSLKEKEEISFQQQTGYNDFWDEGCAHLVEGLKKNKSVKKLNLEGISPSIYLMNIFSGCEITSKGMKALSIFLSQDGIVLEELNLSLKNKGNHFKHQTIKQDAMILGIMVVLVLLRDWKRIYLWKWWI